MSKRRALTLWRQQTEGLVRSWKETDRARGTHILEMVEGEACQDMERNQLNERRSLSEDNRGRNLSGHGKKLTEQWALTNWGCQRKRLVRPWKETDRARGTHILEAAEGETCQDIERNRPIEGYSLPGDGRGRDLSGHRMKSTERGALTSWRQQREGLVRTEKEINRGRRTYFLEMAKGGTCQDKETDWVRGTHSLETAEGRTC